MILSVAEFRQRLTSDIDGLINDLRVCFENDAMRQRVEACLGA